jgi:hypothetical protein
MVKRGELWYIYCEYMYINGKMISVETIQRMKGERMENGGGSAFNYDIFAIL